MIIDKQVLKSKTAAGVEIIFSDKGDPRINLTILSKSKSNLDIETTKTGISDIADLRKSISSDIPVNVVFSGKGIIHTIIPFSEKDDDSSLLQKVLPNAEVNDFYFEKELANPPESTEQSGNNSVLVSILRKNLIDELLNQFSDNEMYVVSASFGPFCLNSIHELMNGMPPENDYEINIADHRLVYKNGKIHKFHAIDDSSSTHSERTVLIGGDPVEQESVVPFAAAFQYLFNDAEKTPTDAPMINKAREEIVNMKLFKILGWGILMLFLGALMINFFLFNSFSRQYQELEQKVFLNKDRLIHYEKLKNEVEEKKLFLQKSGLLEPSRTSYYADWIAANLPKDIQLTEMMINPAKIKTRSLSASGRREDMITFRAKTISIAGKCKKGLALNRWIRIIRDYPWSDDFTIVDYTKDKNAAPGEFLVEITTN